jgi:hypothetical protein
VNFLEKGMVGKSVKNSVDEETRGQLRNPEEEERPPLEAVTKMLIHVMTQFSQ